MKVKELICKLKELDQEKEICYEDDFILNNIKEIIESKNVWKGTDVYVIN